MPKKSICRACLGKSSVKVHIFEPYRGHNIAYFLTSLTDIEVTSEQDNLPDKICSLCFEVLEIIINFKRKFKDSDKYLQSLQKTNISFTQPSNYLVKEEPEEIKFELESATFDCEFPDFDDVNNIIFTDNDQNGNISSLDTESPNARNVQCHDCGEIFKTKCKLRVHWKKIHKPESLTCKLCKKIFSSYPIFKKHSQKQCIDVKHAFVEGVGKNRIFCCKYCDYKNKNYNYLKAHIVKHTKVRAYSCDICGKTFTQWSGVHGHKESAHNIIQVEMTCIHCGKHVKGRARCYKHLKAHSSKRYQCDICKGFLKYRTGLIAHMNRHMYGKTNVAATCEICGKVYTSSSGLSIHKQLVHKNGSSFKCKVCNFQNKNKYIVKTHEKKHFDLSLFKCSDCHRFYDSEKLLAEHCEHVHGPKTHMCLFCDRGFKKKSTVLRHQEITHPDKLKDHEGPSYVIVQRTYSRKTKTKY